MKRHQFALIFLVVAVLAVFAPALIKREVFSLRDHADYFQPLRYFTSIHLKAFVLPYWNPYSASGEAWLANPQTGAFYPPMWLFAVLPFETAYMLFLAFHLIVLGWGTYLLFARTLSEPAALVGAVAVTFCGPTLSLLDVSNNLATFAWVPWVMWSAARSGGQAILPVPNVARRTGRIACPPLFLALAFLAGEPYFAFVAAIIYCVMVRDARRIVTTGILAAGLSAVQLLPFLELLRGSDRAAGLSREQIFTHSMRPLDWLRVAIPPRLSSGAFDAKLSQHFIPVVYIGMFTTALVVIGLVFAARNRRGAGWVALFAVAFLISAGSYLTPIGSIFTHLPVTLFRYPSRMVPFGAFALIALAAMGWNSIRPRGRWADLLLIGLIAVDILARVQPLLATAPFRPDKLPYPVAVGRTAKMLRLNERPIVNRAAWIGGYLNMYQRRYDASTPAPLMNERYRRLHDAAVTLGRLDLLNLLAVGYLFSESPIAALQPVARRGPVTVHANPSVSPMATFWGRAVDYGSAEAALKAAIGGTDAQSLPVSGDIGNATAAYPSVSAVELVSLDSRQARVVVNAPVDGVLLLTQQDAPAWRLYIDGKRSEKILAAGVFRAARLSRGRHEVIWRYESRALMIGFVITIITALSMQLSAFVKRDARSKFF